jgi:hypothetical protein
MLQSILDGAPQFSRSLTICDVRDVAYIHVKALAPEAAGQRIGVGVAGF